MIPAVNSTTNFGIKNPFNRKYREPLKSVTFWLSGYPEYSATPKVSGYIKEYENPNAQNILKQIRNPKTSFEEKKTLCAQLGHYRIIDTKLEEKLNDITK